jgi:RNA polymerase sigma factor (TIGR02999 family)
MRGFAMVCSLSDLPLMDHSWIAVLTLAADFIFPEFPLATIFLRQARVRRSALGSAKPFFSSLIKNAACWKQPAGAGRLLGTPRHLREGKPMSEVSRILSAIEQGDPHAAERLLPLVYEELRNLAAQKLAQEKPGQTLQATALVHEAYLRLVDVDRAQHWNSRGHFFAAAAEAMRRILVDTARSKRSQKHGGGQSRHPLEEVTIVAPEVGEDVVALDEALERLAANDREAAELVKLRFFAGLTAQQAAAALGISARTADRVWGYARAFLLKELKTGRD